MKKSKVYCNKIPIKIKTMVTLINGRLCLPAALDAALVDRIVVLLVIVVPGAKLVKG